MIVGWPIFMDTIESRGSPRKVHTQQGGYMEPGIYI